MGHTLEVTCRVRGTFPLHEVILYKDGVEIMRQKGLNPHFNLTNLTIEDKGMYSCRASWDVHKRTRSVISADTPVQVLGELIAEFGCSFRSHVKRIVQHFGNALILLLDKS